MCASLRPAVFADTVTGSFEDLRNKRYLAYGNVVQNLWTPPGRPIPMPGPRPRPYPTGRRGGRSNMLDLTAPRDTVRREGAVTPEATEALGNAMLLPIPDKNYRNVQIIDTTSCPNFLSDIQKLVAPPIMAFSDGRGARRGIAKNVEARIVEFDVYSIVIASDLYSLQVALRKVDLARRPELPKDMLAAYAKWYPGWTLSLWCFNNTDKKKAKPALIQYDPTAQKDKNDFFIPTLDAHDGNAPDLKAEVALDHTVFVGTNDMNSSYFPSYSDPRIAPGVLELLPKKVRGRNITTSLPNGDLWYKRADLKKGTFQGFRMLPPGAPGRKKLVATI